MDQNEKDEKEEDGAGESADGDAEISASDKAGGVVEGGPVLVWEGSPIEVEEEEEEEEEEGEKQVVVEKVKSERVRADSKDYAKMLR